MAGPTLHCLPAAAGAGLNPDPHAPWGPDHVCVQALLARALGSESQGVEDSDGEGESMVQLEMMIKQVGSLCREHSIGCMWVSVCAGRLSSSRIASERVLRWPAVDTAVQEGPCPTARLPPLSPPLQVAQAKRSAATKKEQQLLAVRGCSYAAPASASLGHAVLLLRRSSPHGLGRRS